VILILILILISMPNTLRMSSTAISVHHSQISRIGIRVFSTNGHYQSINLLKHISTQRYDRRPMASLLRGAVNTETLTVGTGRDRFLGHLGHCIWVFVQSRYIEYSFRFRVSKCIILVLRLHKVEELFMSARSIILSLLRDGYPDYCMITTQILELKKHKRRVFPDDKV